MRLTTREISLRTDESVYRDLDCDIKYSVDRRADELVGRVIEVDGRRAGFVVVTRCTSAFCSANTILQLRLDGEYVSLKDELWREITRHVTIDSAVASTESVAAMLLCLEHRTSLRPLALGFEHGDAAGP